MDHELSTAVLHWNYRGFTEFPIQSLQGGEAEITDIYLKENLISKIPRDIGKLVHLESLYLSGNDITELPREISELRFLKCLDVSGNRLKKIPEEIGDVRNLKFLILDENELTELPLRIAELRFLRYLSVCDNKLKWLPQRPVYNYHHCEFRFWRNSNLRTLPYSLWYHMFKDQQTRSLDIGCLKIPKYDHRMPHNRCQLKLRQDAREWDVDTEFPPQHSTIFANMSSPPSLYEFCRRILYQLLISTAKKVSNESCSIYSDINKMNFNNLKNLGDHFEDIDINNGNINCDLNGNNLLEITSKDVCRNNVVRRRMDYCVPRDIIEEHFHFLPKFIKKDLYVGPVSRCENVSCLKPVFDYAFYEFCLGKIILIDNIVNVVLSATFCSKSCSQSWRNGKSSLFTWTLLEK